MATIKCKYYRAICNCQYGARCKADNFIDYVVGESVCENYEPRSGDRMRVGDLRCAWLDFEEVRFEKPVKSYELDNDYLTMGRTFISTDAIEYLAIDGEVLIDRSAE